MHSPLARVLGAELRLPPIMGALGLLLWHLLGSAQDSPALWRDQGVAHVQDAHVRVALHVLLPVHVMVLDHVCRAGQRALFRARPFWPVPVVPPPGATHL